MKWNSFITVVFTILLIVQVKTNEAQQLSVKEIVVCTSVENRQPAGVDTTFSAGTDRIYCFTKIAGAKDSTSVKHVWYHGDTKRAEVVLNVKADPWRTWSSKKLLPSWTGTWRVDVVDKNGNVIGSKPFIVK